VEVWPCVRLASGFLLIVPGGGGRCFHLTLPADTFEYPPTTIQDLRVHTVSPKAIYLLRSASAATRHEGQRRERDLAVMRQLRARLLEGELESNLVLTLEEMGPASD